VSVTARVDELHTGGDAIVAAEASIDGSVAGNGSALNVETAGADTLVSGEIDTASLETGRHFVLVRARDARGNWGPARAAFLEVVEPTPTSTPTPSATPTAAATLTPEPRPGIALPYAALSAGR
jgi:hypothetical protein